MASLIALTLCFLWTTRVSGALHPDLKPCTSPSQYGYYWSHADDCTKYIQCTGFPGLSYIRSCGSGRVYDPFVQVCVWPNNYMCFHGCSGLNFKVIPLSCGHFFVCAAGIRRLLHCGPGRVYDRSSNSCKNATEEQVRQCRDQIVCPKKTGVIRFADDHNCSLYYTCNNGTRTTDTCPENQMVNLKTGVCRTPTESDFPKCGRVRFDNPKVCISPWTKGLRNIDFMDETCRSSYGCDAWATVQATMKCGIDKGKQTYVNPLYGGSCTTWDRLPAVMRSWCIPV